MMADGNDVVAAEPATQKFTNRWTWPTNTWLAWMVTTLAGILGNAIDTGWSHTETKAILGWAVAGIVAYLVPDRTDGV
jgi:hypothetical protein